MLRVEHLHTRGRVALAAGDVRAAERYRRALVRERTPWSSASALALAAGIRPAPDTLAAAERAYDGVKMRLYAVAFRARRSPDDPEVARFMRDQGVVNPERMVGMLAPVATAGV